MEKETFDKIQILISAMVALKPTVSLSGKKDMRFYHALHELNEHMEKIGCKKFDLKNNKKITAWNT